MATVQVRYIVHDMDAAIAFYCKHLGFQEVMHPSPFFAMLSLEDLRLVLSKPGGGHGGGQSMPDGTIPFRNDIITGVGGKQCIIEDPSRNPVELFQPILPGARFNV